jgi:serine/threonine protein kinase
LIFSTHYDKQDIGEEVIFYNKHAYISDLGLCRPVNDEKPSEEICGIMPYMAPEILRNCPYTKAADIYSFGIIMNEFLSEEIPFKGIPHDHLLTLDICDGIRPRISKDIPKLFADLITKCWDAEIENRPTSKELFLILSKLQFESFNKLDSDSESENENNNSRTRYTNLKDGLKILFNISEDGVSEYDKDDNKDSEDIDLENIEDIYENVEDINDDDDKSNAPLVFIQIKECEKIKENKLKDHSSKNEPENTNTTTNSQKTYNSSLKSESSRIILISDHHSDCEID